MRSDIWFIIGLFFIMGAAGTGTTTHITSTVEYLTALGVWLGIAVFCMFKWNKNREIEAEGVAA